MTLTLKSILMTCTCGLLVSGCASVNKKLDSTQTDAIAQGQKGGLIASIDSTKGVPCTTGSIVFENADTKERAAGRFVFGMFGMKDATSLIATAPGRYFPVEGQCQEMYQSGNYQYTRNHAFMITPGSQKPAIVKAGSVTNPGSYAFSGSKRLQSFTYLDDAANVAAEISKTYPGLTIIENPQ